jgi:hypothetical protein
VERFTVSSSGLGDLAFRLEPVVAENYGEHTWLDVQILLRLADRITGLGRWQAMSWGDGSVLALVAGVGT